MDIVRSDKTALQIASHQGLTQIVELLLNLGANVNLQVSIIISWSSWKILSKQLFIESGCDVLLGLISAVFSAEE